MASSEVSDFLYVYLHGLQVGKVYAPVPIDDTEDKSGLANQLDITTTTETPLSLSLRATKPEPRKVHNWLDGLLPDDPSVRGWWSQLYRVSATPFHLLSTEVGYDCAGAVQFSAHAYTDKMLHRPSGTNPLSDEQIAERLRHFRKMTGIDDATDRVEVHFPQRSLGGWQPKMGLYRTREGWFDPYGNMPSTHIVKLPPIGYPGDCAVETVCQTAASLLGLSAARCTVMNIDDIETIVYLRFDRELTPDGELRRIHHEDMLQALGWSPERKFQLFSGPTPTRIIELLREHSATAEREVEAFVDGLVFNHLIGATDAHAKNYGLRLEGGLISLAPLYDVSSSLPWANGTDSDCAESIFPALWPTDPEQPSAEQPSIRELDERGIWRDFAKNHGLDPVRLLTRIKELADGLPDAFTEAVASLPGDTQSTQDINILLKRIKWRALHNN